MVLPTRKMALNGQLSNKERYRKANLIRKAHTLLERAEIASNPMMLLKYCLTRTRRISGILFHKYYWDNRSKRHSMRIRKKRWHKLARQS